jgi:cell division protein FtsB
LDARHRIEVSGMKRLKSLGSPLDHLKHFAKRAVKYSVFVGLFTVVVAGGIVMSEQSVIRKQQLEEKRNFLERENRRLAVAIKSLERAVTLLSSDPVTIEKAAKKKLGMARTDETVYIFDRVVAPALRPGNSRHGFDKPSNSP